jgi:hypothetical protein
LRFPGENRFFSSAPLRVSLSHTLSIRIRNLEVYKPQTFATMPLTRLQSMVLRHTSTCIQTLCTINIMCPDDKCPRRETFISKTPFCIGRPVCTIIKRKLNFFI